MADKNIVDVQGLYDFAVEQGLKKQAQKILSDHLIKVGRNGKCVETSANASSSRAYMALRRLVDGLEESLNKSNKLTLNEDLFESFGRPDSWNNEPDNNFIVDLGDRDDVCVSFEDAVKSADKNNVDVITEQPPYSNKVIRKWVRDADGNFKLSENESLNEARDFEWDDTLWAVVKEDGRFAGIPCITDTEARDLAYQHEGSHIYKMTLEDSLDEDLILAPQEDALEGPQTEEEVGVSHLILDAISCVTEMISMYNDITANTSNQEIIEVINQIAEDNNKHMGMLQGILTNVSPNAEAIQDGVEEVAADEVVTVDPEFIPVEESLDEEVSDTTLIGKVVANDGKELQKVLAQCGYSNVKHEGHYVFSAIKDGKVVYIDTKPLDDKNESEKIEIKSISESLNEDLHDKFKKDIKNAYKQWAAEVEKVEQQRKNLKDKFQDVESEEKKKEYEELTDKLFPMPADFKFEFPKNIEKDDFPFYVTYYAEYPIYEPAEGGYYYAGKDAIWSEGVNSEEEAWDYVNDFINEQEDKTEWEKFSDGYLLRGQYIGEDQSIIIEPRDSYLSAVKGWEPYQ